MIKYKVSLQKSAIQKADESGVITRDNIYFPQIVGLDTIDFNDLYDVIYANGNTAFTKGEWSGIVLDLGASVANRLISGEKVYLPGLGSFEPTLKTDQSNVKDPSKVNSSHFTCGSKFTPDRYFLANLAHAEWERQTIAAAKGSSSAAYKVEFKKQDGSGNLAFQFEPAAAINAIATSNITVKVNGVERTNLAIANGVLYVNTAVPANGTLTNANVEISLPSVSYTEGGVTKTMGAQVITLEGLTQTGPQNIQD